LYTYAIADYLRAVDVTIEVSNVVPCRIFRIHPLWQKRQFFDMCSFLRPAIVKQPASTEHQAPIEKVLVDLKIGAARLNLMDTTEVQRIIDNVLSSGLVQLPVL
jgi:hypothetical protein